MKTKPQTPKIQISCYFLYIQRQFKAKDKIKKNNMLQLTKRLYIHLYIQFIKKKSNKNEKFNVV